MIDRTASNPRQSSFEGVNLNNLKLSIDEQICALTDGPCTCGGDNVRTVHKELDINELEFIALVEDCVSRSTTTVPVPGKIAAARTRADEVRRRHALTGFACRPSPRRR